MHDCRKAKKNLMDLVFGELESVQRQQVLAEVGNCPACLQEYQSMQATLRMFDQAADAAMPDESYWIGYNARLRDRLAEPVSLNFQGRFSEWVATLLARPAIPVTAMLILLAASSAVWFLRHRVTNPQVLVAQTTPTPLLLATSQTPAETGASQNQVGQEPQSTVAVTTRQSRLPRASGTVAKAKDSTPDNPMPNYSQTDEISPVLGPAAHFEKAQLLLRSFRNARTEGKSAPLDLAYEKRQAGKLVYDNILLRREAEAKGYLPVEEALNSLEPLLLDIANLPQKPSRAEVQTIRERIQKQELIATLQIVSNGPERFSPPALLNP